MCEKLVVAHTANQYAAKSFGGGSGKLSWWRRSAFVRYAIVGAIGFALGGTGGILAAGTIAGPNGLLTACYYAPKQNGNGGRDSSRFGHRGRRRNLPPRR